MILSNEFVNKKREEEKMDKEPKTEVSVINISMPFLSMVTFMVKWAIATIPAIIILVVIWMVVGGMLGGLVSW